MSELFRVSLERNLPEHWEPAAREADPLEEYLAWRQDFLKLAKEWEKSEVENRAEQDVVLTGMAAGNPSALTPERLQALQTSLAGNVGAQFATYLSNPFYVGAMLVSYHSLMAGGEGIEVSSDLPMADHLTQYQNEVVREREQHRYVRALLAKAS